MKKVFILFIFLMVTLSLQAQTAGVQKTPYSSTVDKYTYILWGATAADYVHVLHNIITYPDSLIGADTVTYNYLYKSEIGEINLYNGGADADSATIEFYDSFNSRYTTEMIGLTDLSNDSLITNTSEIVIENGKSKRFKINTTFPGIIRIIPKVATGQAADKIYIGFIGKN